MAGPREEVVAPIAAKGDELMFFTYSGHPVCCAAGLKNIEIMEREKIFENVRMTTTFGLVSIHLSESQNRSSVTYSR